MRQRQIRGEKVQEMMADTAAVDPSALDPEVLNDPIKLLQWLADSGDSSHNLAIGIGEGKQNSAAGPDFSSAYSLGRKESFRSVTRRPANISNLSESQSIPWEIKYLNAHNIPCVDSREKGGALWIIGDYSIAVEISFLRSCGLNFRFKKEGSRATKDAPGWWTKTGSPSKPNKLILDDDDCQEDKSVDIKNPLSLGASTEASRCQGEQELSNNSEDIDRTTPLAVPELVGLLIGITCDGRVNELEARTLSRWLGQIDSKNDSRIEHIKGLLERVLLDGIVDADEEREMLALFNKIIGIADQLSANIQKQQEAIERTPKKSDTVPVDIQCLKKSLLRYIDLRDKGGALWVIGGNIAKPVINQLKCFGMHFSYSSSGSVATGYSAGWWTKDCPKAEKDPSSIEAEHSQLDNFNEEPTVKSSDLFESKSTPSSATLTKGVRMVLVDVSGHALTIQSSTISYIKANGTTSYVHGKKTGVVEVSAGLFALESRLIASFIRPHRSYLVSIEDVKRVIEEPDGTFLIELNSLPDRIPAHKSSRALLVKTFGRQNISFTG